MATIFIEGFDHFSTANMVANGWSGANASMQTGRLGGQCGRWVNNTGLSIKSFLGGAAGSATVYVGFAIRVVTTPAATHNVMTLRGGGAGIFLVKQTTSNTFQLCTAAGTVIATTSALTVNVWYYLEIKVFFNGASGTVEARLNGVTDVASTTGNFGSTTADALSIGTTQPSAAGLDFDDMYVVDTTGSARNSWLGDQRVETLYASGTGNSSAWAASTGTAPTCIDESVANGDTDYISSSVVNNVSTFAFGDLSISNGAVNGVQVSHWVRKDDVATRQIATVVRQGGTDYVAATHAALSTSYIVQEDIYDKDPTATTWTISNVNADEFGVKQIA